MIKDIKNWKEVTKGLYRYVIAANAAYEIHILHQDTDTDINNAAASLYIAGDWTDLKNNSFFERESLITDATVNECLSAAEKDYTEEVEIH